jgi:gliding motility-associated-like protein
MFTGAMKRYFLLFVIVARSLILEGQYLDNPSFEGPPGIALTPPSWIPFMDLSTPDTEPLLCDDFPASDGETYITLVVRGSDSPRSLSAEDCQTQLLAPLLSGNCYNLSVDIAHRDDLGHYEFGKGFRYYVAETGLRIYGSSDISEKGALLAETESISNREWQTYTFTLQPEFNVHYLLLEATAILPSVMNGNILLDNLKLEEENEPVLNDDFKIPNVFTPNGDNVNDYFEILALPPYSSLMIFDRSGQEVFRSEHYNNDWNGTDKDHRPLPGGTYWYVLITPGISGKYTGHVYLKND